jgi:Uma2 family endonuclease
MLIAPMKVEGAVEASDPRADHFVRAHNVTWAGYQAALARRGQGSAPRITYLEGELQIMSPGYDHEAIGSLIGRLVEAYCIDRDIELCPVGSWTIKERRVQRGAEPDECYVFGRRRKRPTRPDLAIEVVWTSGGIDKLEVYRLLDVREVWMWVAEKRAKGRIQVFRLHGERYRPLPRSRFLPDLDLELLERFAHRPTVNQAVRGFRAALGRKRRATPRAR